MQLTALVANHRAHAAAAGLKCGGKTAVCVGPLSYQVCVDDVTSGPVIACEANTRCVSEGLQICVPVKTAAALAPEAPTAAVAKMVTITDSPVSESAPLVEASSVGAVSEISTEGPSVASSAAPTTTAAPEVTTTGAPVETTQVPPIETTTNAPIEETTLPSGETTTDAAWDPNTPAETTLAPGTDGTNPTIDPNTPWTPTHPKDLLTNPD